MLRRKASFVRSSCAVCADHAHGPKGSSMVPLRYSYRRVSIPRRRPRARRIHPLGGPAPVPGAGQRGIRSNVIASACPAHRGCPGGPSRVLPRRRFCPRTDRGDAQRDGVPAERLAGAASYRSGGNAVVHGASSHRRPAPIHSGGRPGQRREPHRSHHPLPPRGGRRWRPHGVRWRSIAQAMAPPPRVHPPSLRGRGLSEGFVAQGQGSTHRYPRSREDRPT